MPVVEPTSGRLTIIVLPFEKAGFTIYSASIITSDKMLQENPDLVKRFLRATQRSFRWARDNQLEACKLHVKKNPVVDVDDCQGSLRATVKFVFNSHSKSTGLGQIDDERLSQALNDQRYLDATRDVLKEHDSLWFQDESYIISRKRD